MAKLTLLDIAKRSGNDPQVGIVESMVQTNALLNNMPFKEINGISYKFARRKGLPTVGFRGYNQGIDASKSIVEQILIEAKNIGGRSQVDKLLAEADPRGVTVVRSEEDAGFVAAMGNLFNSKAYYGNSKTTLNEFDGVATILSSISGTAIGAGGSTGSSIYAFAFGDANSPQGRMKGVEGVLGNAKNITALDMGLQYALDADSKQFLAYTTEFEFAPGLAVYDTRSIGRLANIDSTHKPTITLLNQLMTAMYPFVPSVFTCSKVTFNYIQELKGTSIADVTVGTNLYTRVLSFNGVPILIDENIKDDETAIS